MFCTRSTVYNGKLQTARGKCQIILITSNFLHEIGFKTNKKVYTMVLHIKNVGILQRFMDICMQYYNLGYTKLKAYDYSKINTVYLLYFLILQVVFTFINSYIYSSYSSNVTKEEIKFSLFDVPHTA